MTRLEAALLEVGAILDELRIPYIPIGGLAVAQWEEPRAILDVKSTPTQSASQMPHALPERGHPAI